MREEINKARKDLKGLHKLRATIKFKKRHAFKMTILSFVQKNTLTFCQGIVNKKAIGMPVSPAPSLYLNY